MLKHRRHIVVSILLFGYLTLGIIGHLEALILYGWGDNPQHLAKSTQSPTSTCKVYWTQYKHLPSEIKNTVPSPAVIKPPEMFHRNLYGIAYVQSGLCLFDDPVSSRYSSRAPPQA
jgi:hypothetical protein